MTDEPKRAASGELAMHGYVEVTIAAALLRSDGSFVHNDMADVTVAFGFPTVQPPRALTEAESKESILQNLSRVAAAIEAMLLMNGAQHLGQVEQPMTEGSHEVGRAVSDAIRLHIVEMPEPRSS